MLILLYTTLVIHLVPQGIRSLPGLVALYGCGHPLGVLYGALGA